ncbi:hypothetical protein LF41_2282 [Lysobacter dokdonensis DS-58]|uniref:Uncharacterized protein n=1 Tax=Lysobacter dokdonensis DS-58 TaxID=1300345 RepID=A0A0A2WNB9_9GAMM|nr:hypothetical protein [Lysobacter dokdonensis]KGQ19780.1 hypothetical protein LF41_2282 [Lysobacter dokdonensis DS-58]
MRTNDPWKVHGYFFFACFGIFMAAIGRLFTRLMNIPPDVPVIEYLPPAQQIVFLLLLGVSAAMSYLLARIASLAFHNLIDYFKK